MKKIIEVKDLQKTYKTYKKETGLKGSIKNLFKRETILKEAVRGISFDIEEGEFIGFIGPNGAGKTTTLKMLSGILYPTSGTVKAIGEFVPWERNPEYQRQFGIVMGQKNQLWWDLPPMETFVLNKEIYDIPDKEFEETIEELSTLLDVKEQLKIQARRLSLGERMKCELIAALLHKPKILFLDEPTIGLDVNSQMKVRDFLKDYNEKSKTTIILTSHYMKDIQRLCKRVIVIDLGKILFDGKLEDLMKTYTNQKRIELILEKNAECQLMKKYGKVIECEDERVVLEVSKDKIAEITSEIMKEFKVEDLSITEVDIEEVIGEIFAKNEKKSQKTQ